MRGPPGTHVDCPPSSWAKSQCRSIEPFADGCCFAPDSVHEPGRGKVYRTPQLNKIGLAENPERVGVIRAAGWSGDGRGGSPPT